MDSIQFNMLDDDGRAIALSVKAQLYGFAGEAEAYFECDALLAFCAALDVYPLAADQPPEMASGVKGADPRSQQGELVRILVRPHDKLGKLRLEVQLTEASTPWIVPITRSVSAWRLITYADAAELASAVRSLVQRKVGAKQVLFADPQ